MSTPDADHTASPESEGLTPGAQNPDHRDPPGQEPLVTVDIGPHRLTLLGTAHVSRASADKVRELLENGDYDTVAVELCPSRYHAIVNPDALARMDLFRMMREGKTAMVAASLALGAYQQRMAEQFGIRPGEEMRTAVAHAETHGLSVLLIDREVGITLRRIYRSAPWWRRAYLLSGLLASVVSREQVSEEEIERLKEGDMLESTFAQFATEARELYEPLIAERDRYMALRLLADLAAGDSGGHVPVEGEPRGRHLLAVVGAGHLKGIQSALEARPLPAPEALQAELEHLDQLPPASRWPRRLPWVIVAVILIGFALGFSHSTALGWRLVLEWVVINGGLAALGALLAAAHPLTVVTAFVAAPLTSLNPMIGAGMVTAAVEIFLRRPSVGDFGRLRSDTRHPAGWWRNRVSRTLLVFLFSTLGSAIGTYLAGFRIFEHLAR